MEEASRGCADVKNHPSDALNNAREFNDGTASTPRDAPALASALEHVDRVGPGSPSKKKETLTSTPRDAPALASALGHVDRVGPENPSKKKMTTTTDPVEPVGDAPALAHVDPQGPKDRATGTGSSAGNPKNPNVPDVGGRHSPSMRSCVGFLHRYWVSNKNLNLLVLDTVFSDFHRERRSNHTSWLTPHGLEDDLTQKCR